MRPLYLCVQTKWQNQAATCEAEKWSQRRVTKNCSSSNGSKGESVLIRPRVKTGHFTPETNLVQKKIGSVSVAHDPAHDQLYGRINWKYRTINMNCCAVNLSIRPVLWVLTRSLVRANCGLGVNKPTINLSWLTWISIIWYCSQIHEIPSFASTKWDQNQATRAHCGTYEVHFGCNN